MKKNFFIIFFVVLVGISSASLIISQNKKQDNNSRNVSGVKHLTKPNGITAYTLDNKSTDVSYEDLLNYYTLEGIICKNGTVAKFDKKSNTVSFSDVKVPDYCTMNFSSQTISSHIFSDNKTISERTDFSTVFTSNTANTLYKATENGINVYYFAGVDSTNAPINNWVKFGGFYWRIIRTNSDGSVKLLYFGSSTTAIDGYIGTTAFNTSEDSPKYAGYMYGNSDSTLDEARTNTNDSAVKAVIDNWYKTNFTSYTNYLSNDAVYCNDRELANGSEYSTTKTFNFKSRDKIYSNGTPSYECTNSKDAFSVNNEEAKLTYPIALMTADEARFAGGVYNVEANLWYYTNASAQSVTDSKYWWLMTPSFWNETELKARSWYAMGSTKAASLDNWYVSTSNRVVRPVISLKSCAKWSSGNGSANTPYEVEMNGGC